MGLTTVGSEEIAKAIMGTAITAFSNANAYLGVGNSTTAFAVGQTDLQGASKLRKAQDVGYPTRTSGTLTYRSTFGTTEANFAWQEWALFNASSSGSMLNRKVESLGTKSAGSTWQLTVTFAFS